MNRTHTNSIITVPVYDWMTKLADVGVKTSTVKALIFAFGYPGHAVFNDEVRASRGLSELVATALLVLLRTTPRYVGVLRQH